MMVSAGSFFSHWIPKHSSPAVHRSEVRFCSLVATSLWLKSFLGPVSDFPRQDSRYQRHEEKTETPSSCSTRFSVTDFFSDSPWLNIPRDRLGEIVVEPLYPRGGLLGGSSKPDGAPKSKLAALAAARKKKPIQRDEDAQNATSSIALLDKLSGKPRQLKPNSASSGNPNPLSVVTEQTVHEQSRKYPRRKSKEPESPQRQQPAEALFKKSDSLASPDNEKKSEITPTARPSIFARTIFSTTTISQQHDIRSSDRYLVRPDTHTEFNFAGPSPDDIVTKAQNAKGPTQKPVRQPPQPSSGDKSVNTVAQSVGNVTIEEPKVRGKNLDVVAEFERSKPKNAANFVVIGHVDAGKSKLMGRLLYDL